MLKSTASTNQLNHNKSEVSKKEGISKKLNETYDTLKRKNR